MPIQLPKNTDELQRQAVIVRDAVKYYPSLKEDVIAMREEFDHKFDVMVLCLSDGSQVLLVGDNKVIVVAGRVEELTQTNKEDVINCIRQILADRFKASDELDAILSEIDAAPCVGGANGRDFANALIDWSAPRSFDIGGSVGILLRFAIVGDL